MKFAENLQRLRRARGMSQEALAEAVGVSRQAISKWESGQAVPEIDKIIRLSKLFQVSIDSMVKEDADGPSPAAGGNSAPVLIPVGYVPYHGYYEYVSKRRLFGVPLVHINVGYGKRVAKGIIAIGNISVGVLSIGAVSLGGICLGAFAVGLFCAAAFAVGLLAAVGGVAVGAVALGGVAVGLISVGGCAVAYHVAVGGYANGHIAIGEVVKGARTIRTHGRDFSPVTAAQVSALLRREYPHLWKPVADFILHFFG